MVLTLAWTHSIEKTRWEEDWRATPAGLVLAEDCIQSTGAGMEPPPDAHFDGQWWHYKPPLPPMPNVILRRSGATDDWQVCIAARCRPMRDYLPKDADPVTLTTCP
ncbi:MAG: DUF1850 domain-containing protein [Nevskiales bacterium]